MNTQIKQPLPEARTEKRGKALERVLTHVKETVGILAVFLLMLTNPYGSTLFWVAFALMWVLLLEPIAALMGWIDNPFRRIWDEAKRQHP